MPYASAQDLIDRYPAKDLQELTSEDGESIDSSVLDRALADASDVIDGYLGSRYALPLVSVPRVLTLYACTLAMYQLAQLRPQTDVADLRARYDDVIKYLTSVAGGDVSLGLSTTDTPPVQSDEAVVIAPPRMNSRCTLEGL